MTAWPWYLLAAGIILVIVGSLLGALMNPPGSGRAIHSKMTDDEISRRLRTRMMTYAPSAPAPRSNTTAATSAASSRRRGARALRGGGDISSCSSACRASTTASALPGRSAGSLLNSLTTRLLTVGRTARFTSQGGAGLSVASAVRTAIVSPPLNGNSPVVTQYRTQPRLNRSQR